MTEEKKLSFEQQKLLTDMGNELAQSIHDIMAKHMSGKPINFNPMLSIVIAALTPNIGDMVSFIPDESGKKEAISTIRTYFGSNLANSIEDYLKK